MTYVDEYGALETGEFMKELQWFCGRRLPDLDENLAASIAYQLIAKLAPVTPPIERRNLPPRPEMTAREYAFFCASCLADLGWDVQLTLSPKHRDVRIICRRGAVRMIMRTHLSPVPITEEAVEELAILRDLDFTDDAAVVSNATYTASARKLALATGIRLLHQDDLANL